MVTDAALPDRETTPLIRTEAALPPAAIRDQTSHEETITRDHPPPSSAAPPDEQGPPLAPGASPLRLIRDAIAAGDLDRAELLLGEERNRLSAAGDAERMALAELTGLAGDHAAAAGRIGSAKWLWRLALQRFAAADAIGVSSARDVSERLRLADN